MISGIRTKQEAAWKLKFTQSLVPLLFFLVFEMSFATLRNKAVKKYIIYRFFDF